MNSLPYELILNILLKLTPSELIEVTKFNKDFRQVAKDNQQRLMTSSLKLINKLHGVEFYIYPTKSSEINLDLFWNFIGSERSEEDIIEDYKRLSYENQIIIQKTTLVLENYLSNILPYSDDGDWNTVHTIMYKGKDFFINFLREFKGKFHDKDEIRDHLIKYFNELGGVYSIYIPGFFRSTLYVDPKYFTSVANNMNKEPSKIFDLVKKYRTKEFILSLINDNELTELANEFYILN